MTDIQIYITLGVFAAVILVIAFDVLDMSVAAVLGATTLYTLGNLDSQDLEAAVDTSGGTIALLFGGMVVARTLTGTGLFERIGNELLRIIAGSGRRFLLLLIALVARPAQSFPMQPR